MIKGRIPDEIREGPDAIRATVEHSLRPAREAAEDLRSRDVRRVHLIGNGTSYHSCLAAAALYRRHAGPADPVVIPLTSAEFRLYRPLLDARDAVVGISSSGEFRDVVAVAEELRGRTPVVGIVHVPGSTLTRVASRTVLSAGGPSTVPVMTKTFSCTLVATELVLLGLLDGDRAAGVVDEIARAADHAQVAIAAAEALVPELVERLAGREHLFVAGGGLAYPAALEAALKLKEMALVHAEGAETWEMTSGAATMLGPSAVVIGLAPTGPARGAMAELLGHATQWGADVIEVGPEALVRGSGLLPLPVAALEDHASLTAVPPVALLAFALARRRGADPDHPDWIERYHSQGLTHILGAGEAAT